MMKCVCITTISLPTNSVEKVAHCYEMYPQVDICIQPGTIRFVDHQKAAIGEIATILGWLVQLKIPLQEDFLLARGHCTRRSGHATFDYLVLHSYKA